MRIAVDAMGGDFGTEVNVRGALEALELDSTLDLYLVGVASSIRSELKKLGRGEVAGITLVEATEVISMEDHAAAAIRKKKDSSIHVGLRMVREGKADAFISAGNSGAVMAGALFLVGRIGNLERPAIVVKLPSASGYVSVLDVGANVDCRASHLADFAIMGSAYANLIEGIKAPRIGLLSNGSESHKGNELTRQTHELLSANKGIHYIGYIEGYDIFNDSADVVICDGFVGNVVLKAAEGIADAFVHWFRAQLKGNILGLVGVVLLRNVLRGFRKKFDYQPYGAAPLLGIDGMVLISHGKSTPVAIRNGILNAKKGVEQRLVEKISGALVPRAAEGVKS
ncbi:MAG: phosphate acyltransferase PlsX [Deltaproteobacteria bacterium]|nr:phosphate acyltransferase PlsX [Deltaproteobacteria bacterium]MBI3293583.1 phosphate acyltransferase PlsX [Deltaproteobacteria bacterium]